MMRITFLFFCLALLLGACSKKTKVVQQEEEAVPDIVLSEEVVLVEEEVVEIPPEVEEVYLLCAFRRSSCYGKCPVYEVKIYSDGNATYSGSSNVEKIGTFTSFCNPQNFESIFLAAEKANFFVLNSQYPINRKILSDLPQTITYLKRNGLEKRILDNFDAPVELTKFEDWLDVFFDSLNWEKAEE